MNLKLKSWKRYYCHGHRLSGLLKSLMFLGMALGVVCVSSPAVAKISLDIRVHPNVKKIEVGGQIKEITLIARMNIDGVKCHWEIDGPGKLEGDRENRKILYIPPENISSKSQQVEFSVTVTDEQAGSASKTLTLNLVSSQPCPPKLATPVSVPTPEPLPAPEPPPRPSQELERLLNKADEYFQRTYYLKPKGRNAFKLYQKALSIDPMNTHARKKIHEMRTMYKKWAETAFNTQKFPKACEYYARYTVVADYLITRLNETGLASEMEYVKNQLIKLACSEKSSAPTPKPTSLPTLPPTPTATATPWPTVTPTLAPSPTPTATPTPWPTSTPTLTPTMVPTPTPLTDELLQKASRYCSQNQYTTPKGENAFEAYKKVLRIDPGNSEAKFRLYEIARLYKNGGDTAYRQHRYSRAIHYYYTYELVVDYLLEKFSDRRLIQDFRQVHGRLQAMLSSPTPTATPTRVPTATPTPNVPLQITGVEVKDLKGSVIRERNGCYTVKKGQPVKIRVEFTAPLNHDIGVAWTTGHGKVLPIENNTNTFIGTQLGGDYIVIIVWDKETSKEIQHAVNVIVNR